MAKKGTAKALQLTITTNRQWEEFLETPGLLIVDVYSNWSGPCAAMISTLRKVKFELERGVSDIINYAISDNSEVTDLERFRYTSEPCWMFLEKGRMVNFMFGSDCPQFRKLLLSEIERVKHDGKPQWSCLPCQRAPEEEIRWLRKEAIRKEIETKLMKEKLDESKRKYEAYLEQMMYELCEETGILIFPHVFLDENGERILKERVPLYSELRNDLFLECFDIVEERELVFNPDDYKDVNQFCELIKMREIIEDWREILQRGKYLIMRLRSRPPHPDWPVPYPNTCPEGTSKCPNRAIDDVENYLARIITDKPFPLTSANLVRRTYDESFWTRHLIKVEDKIYPPVWFPANATQKVEFFNIFFKSYMDRYHTYVQPEPPLPLCAFKFKSEIFETLRETCTTYANAIDYIGVFEYDRPPIARRLVSTIDDFLNKVQVKTGREIMVVIVMRINEETFLSFAGIGAYFISEDQHEIREIIMQYFSPNVIDELVNDENDEEEEEEYIDEEIFDEEEFYNFGEEEDISYGVIEQ